MPSMYEVSVPVFVHMLESLRTCLGRAAEDAAQRGYAPGILVATRLRPDMMPLAQQVQVATNHATDVVARLAGVALPEYGDDAPTLEALQARIDVALAFLKTTSPAQIDGSEDREIVLPKRTRVRHLELAGLAPYGEGQGRKSLYPVTFRGSDYLLHFALPNFYFHVTTAYAILRSSGVAVGKHDYLGHLPRIDR